MSSSRIEQDRSPRDMVACLDHRTHWRRLDGQNQLPKVIRGVSFADGIKVAKKEEA
jgi:hypothetical protein